MIESQTSVDIINRNLMLSMDYCKFRVNLHNGAQFMLLLHKKDTLYDLHQKLTNFLHRIRTPKESKVKMISINPIDYIPPKDSNRSQEYLYKGESILHKDKVFIHDIFICHDNITEILSIPSNDNLLISEFIDMHKDMFNDTYEYHNIYVIDNEYLQKSQYKKKGSFMNLIMHTILCKI
jgi:hypothetical protein